LFDDDPETKLVVLFCEPGGIIEEKLAEFVMAQKSLIPLVAFVAGRFVDKMPGIRFGHAATIVEGDRGTTKGKIAIFKKAGIRVAESFSDIVMIAKEYLSGERKSK
jgi:succinyl-CoA synthetase alpha subunit